MLVCVVNVYECANARLTLPLSWVGSFAVALNRRRLTNETGYKLNEPTTWTQLFKWFSSVQRVFLFPYFRLFDYRCCNLKPLFSASFCARNRRQNAKDKQMVQKHIYCMHTEYMWFYFQKRHGSLVVCPLDLWGLMNHFSIACKRHKHSICTLLVHSKAYLNGTSFERDAFTG